MKIEAIQINLKRSYEKYGKLYYGDIRLKESVWLLLYALLLLPTALINDPKPSLDSSWGISLDLAIEKGLCFGKEFCFTYGPLGFLHTKLVLAHSKWVLLLFDLSILGLTIFVLRRALQFANHHIFTSMAIAPVLFLVIQTELVFMIPVLFFVMLIFYFDSHNKIYLYVAMVLSVLSFYIKVNYGLVLYFVLYISLVFAICSKSITTKHFILAIIVHLSATLLFSFSLNVDLIGYVKVSKHLIDSYNDAMVVYLEWNSPFLICAILSVLLFTLGLIYYFKLKTLSLPILLGFLFSSVYSYLIFKNAFVRADGHMLTFFRLFPFSFGITYLFVLKAQSKLWAYLSCIGILIGLSGIMLFKIRPPVQITLQIQRQSHIESENKAPKPNYLQKILKLKYFKQIMNYDLEAVNLELGKSKVARLNASFVGTIGEHTMDVMPTETSMAYKYGFNYCPRPIIQSYSAYDLYLDSLNFLKYESNKAPNYIIYQNTYIDDRTPFWDESLTKRSILSNYTIIAEDSTFQNDYSYTDSLSKSKLVLLERLQKPNKLTVIKKEELKLTINKPYEVAKTKNVQYLYADISYSNLGKIKRFVFQPPILYVTFTYDDKTKATFQAIVPLLKTGVLLNKRVNTTDEFSTFMRSKGIGNKNVNTITFITEEKYGFISDIKARIEEMTIQ